ncbi:MAG: hypothetical protein GY785_10535 [Gammaproteobacteria bacterium]|nr:hypothetical protein [Gammaproteobacteria bacterium]
MDEAILVWGCVDMTEFGQRHQFTAHGKAAHARAVELQDLYGLFFEQSPTTMGARFTLAAVVGDKDDWRVQGRVISLAADGVVEGLRYNGNSIGQLDLSRDLVEPAYSAPESFESILYDRDLWWRPMLTPGDLLVIDNHRVLHGREAFDAAAGERHLQCCYVVRDDFHNNYRRMAKRLHVSKWGRRLSSGVI